MAGPLGIIAGQGGLPVELAAAVAASGRGVVLAEMEGHPSGVPGGHPVVTFRVERLGRLFRDLRRAGVEEVAMAGILHRPAFDPRCFDLKTLALVPRIFRGLRAGDDALLRLVIAIFEENGFRIRGAHEFLADLVVPPGPMTREGPSRAQKGDAARGRAILAAIGPEDVAQACVVARGLCLGIEAIYGTDALLSDVARHRPERRPETGGTFVKVSKPGQEMRADMPVIGPATVAGAAAAGLDGICLEAGRVMILDAPNAVRMAEEKGICIWAT
ncbi:LpxI family protein [Poseidonocella sp. HB161398]|uniref:LpxI family protein n=1 Tax=Poseidonocella sp. HB161398 TaxID=2320855 RepID=UPI0021059494|nr:UDP-2,3-diacylglucosamine diphosphatase LpxI [Poseidonocella sp. HB161398]